MSNVRRVLGVLLVVFVLHSAPRAQGVWTPRASGITSQIHDVVWNGTKYLAVGGANGNPDSSILSSPDGVTWTKSLSPYSGIYSANFYKALWTGSQYVALVDASLNSWVRTSVDGVAWGPATVLGDRTNYNSLAWNGNLFVATGESDSVHVSPDGTAWTVHPVVPGFTLKAVIWAGNQFVAVGQSDSGGIVATSPDGAAWTRRKTGFNSQNYDLTGAVWTGSELVVYGTVGGTTTVVLASPDGLAWTQRAQLTSTTFRSLVWTGRQFVAAGGTSTPRFYTSPNGTTWTTRTPPGSNVPRVVLWANGRFVAAGYGGAIWTSAQYPSIPQLNAPGVGDTVPVSPTLAWASDSSAQTYRLQVSTSSNFSSLAFEDSGLVAPSKTVGPLSTNTTYYWRVSAKNAGGADAFSSSSSFVTYPPIPSIPTLVTPAADANAISASAVIRWRKAADAVQYRLQVALDSGFATLVLHDSTLTDTSRTASGMAYNTNHYWRVQARNKAGAGAWSVTRKFTTLAPPPAPILNTPAHEALGVGDSPTLSWNAAANAANYRLQLSTNSGFSTFVVHDSTLTGLGRAVGPLTPKTTYYWRVQARNAAGAGAFSDIWTFTSVVAMPLITAQPRDTTVIAGATAVFSVTATGDSLTYQWRKGTANLAGVGATTANFSLAGAAMTDTASTYNVVVTATGSGTATRTSSSARLYVNVPPVIAMQPSGSRIAPGSPLTLTVAAQGAGSSSGTLSYQWRKNGEPVASGTGGTTATYTLASPTAPDSGTYSVVLTRTLNGTVTQTTSADAVVTPPVGILPRNVVFRAAGGHAPFAFLVDAGGEDVESVTLVIRDVQGRTVWSKSVSPSRDGKRTEIAWNGRTSGGASTSAGVYVAHLMIRGLDGAIVRDVRKAVTLKPVSGR